MSVRSYSDWGTGRDGSSVYPGTLNVPRAGQGGQVVRAQACLSHSEYDDPRYLDHVREILRREIEAQLQGYVDPSHIRFEVHEYAAHNMTAEYDPFRGLESLYGPEPQAKVVRHDQDFLAALTSLDKVRQAKTPAQIAKCGKAAQVRTAIRYLQAVLEELT